MTVSHEHEAECADLMDDFVQENYSHSPARNSNVVLIIHSDSKDLPEKCKHFLVTSKLTSKSTC